MISSGHVRLRTASLISQAAVAPTKQARRRHVVLGSIGSSQYRASCVSSALASQTAHFHGRSVPPVQARSRSYKWDSRDHGRRHHDDFLYRFNSSMIPSAGPSIDRINDQKQNETWQSTSSLGSESSVPLTRPPLENMDRQQLIDTLDELYSLLLARVPKGFENFLPRNARTGNGNKGSDGDGDGNDDGDEKKDKEKKSKDAEKFSAKDDKSSSDNQNKKKNNKWEEERRKKRKEEEELQQQAAGATLLLILVLMARSFLEDDSPDGTGGVSALGGDGPEVTWADFYNYMLTQGDVERIVVVNKKVARVYLRPGARGVPITASGRGIGGTSRQTRAKSSASGGLDGIPPGKGGTQEESWDDGTVMEISGGSSAPAESAPVSSGLRRRQHQLVYHFNIGSVESFEDKLTRSQQELNISPRDFVPVQYASETNWVVELIKSAPALFLIGLTAYMLRGMGGVPGAGGGSRGGMGGIFQMGKSNAKLIKKEDVSVTFKDVAGCQEAKKEIMEFVDFLQDASQFTKLGAKIPKGALLTGPPGTGELMTT